MVALLQQVVYRELLPVVLGSAPMDHFSLWLQNDGYFTGYNSSVDPSTPNVFATAAFRLVTPGLLYYLSRDYDSQRVKKYNNLVDNETAQNEVR